MLLLLLLLLRCFLFYVKRMVQYKFCNTYLVSFSIIFVAPWAVYILVFYYTPFFKAVLKISKIASWTACQMHNYYCNYYNHNFFIKANKAKPNPSKTSAIFSPVKTLTLPNLKKCPLDSTLEESQMLLCQKQMKSLKSNFQMPGCQILNKLFWNHPLVQLPSVTLSSLP